MILSPLGLLSEKPPPLRRREYVTDRLKQARERIGLTQWDLAIRVRGLTNKMVSNYETGVSFPRFEMLVKILKALDVSPDFLLQDDVEIKKIGAENFLPDEKRLIYKYRKIDEYGKRLINTVLDLEIERCKRERKEENYSRNIKSIPLGYFSLSAGTGTPYPEDNYEMIEVDADRYPKADMAFRVSGDSMEPRFFDGDIVYIHRQPVVEVGEIGAFIYNDEQYIKKLVCEDGVYKLRSFNEKYKDIEIVSQNFITYGKVVN